MSRRVHSRYQRRLADTASGGQEVLIHLQARRFFCGNGACAKGTFAEQVPGLASRYGRRTCGLQVVLQAIGLALGGRAGARLTGRLACSVSRSTLLRMIRAAPDPQSGTPLGLGVDDFALRKGHIYGTVLVDIETRGRWTFSPSGRRSPSALGWTPTRGWRSSAGTAAAATPKAPLRARRWPPRSPTGGICGTTLLKRSSVLSPATRCCLQEPPPQPEPGPPAEDAAPSPKGGLAARTRTRHGEIHALLASGLTITEIGRTLRLERKTVRRYATADTADQLITGIRLSRPGLLGPHQAYLRQRWDEGVRSTNRLHQELRERGYRGSLRTLRRLTAQLRADTAVPAPPPAPPAKRVASWLLTPPGKLTGDDRAALAQITGRCQELATTRDLVREFADMLCYQHGEHLEAWADRAETRPVSELRGFSKGLRKDWAAVTAGLTTAYGSGAVEGNVNRIILWNQFVRFCSGSALGMAMTGSSLPVPGCASWRGASRSTRTCSRRTSSGTFAATYRRRLAYDAAS